MGIAFIGEEDCIKAFQGLGIDVFPVEDSAGAEETLDRLKEQGCPVAFITETFAGDLLARIEKITSTSRMNVIIIPGIGDKKDIAGEMMRRITIRATGMDPVKDE